MKKILITITCIIITFCLSGCSNGKLLSSKEISDKMYAQKFTVNNVTKIVDDSNIKNAMTFNNGKYQFEYYEFVSEKLAKESYKKDRDAFKAYKTKTSKDKETNKDNYSKYTLELKDTYDIVIRKKNTIIYASVNSSHKNDLVKMIAKLNY